MSMMWAMFAGGLGVLLINFFYKHWILNLVVMFLMAGVLLTHSANVWMQFACILIMVWQFLAGLENVIESYL